MKASLNCLGTNGSEYDLIWRGSVHGWVGCTKREPRIFIDDHGKEVTFRKALYVAGSIAGITMILIMFGETLFSFSGAGDQRYNNPGFITKLRSSRIEFYNKGLLLALSISIGALGLMWGLIHKKINKHIFN